jgi:hypothetical protein
MKLLRTIALIPLLGCTLSAQTYVDTAPPVVMVPAAFTAEQLDQLLGPIALYPDALLAIILPASTNPAEITSAAGYLQSGGDPAQVEFQPWDDSVKALARYPELVNWMSQNFTWTTQLGQAFANQETEVMNAVQHLRAEAWAAGTLTNTPQQQIVVEGDTIAIVPAQPDVIYVPYYDPQVVYVPQPSYGSYYRGPLFRFSVGYVAGSWLSFGFNWRERHVWAVDHAMREQYWREHHDWRRRSYVPYSVAPSAPGIRPWHPHADSRFSPRHEPTYVAPAPAPSTSYPVPNHNGPYAPRDRRPGIQTSPAAAPAPTYRAGIPMPSVTPSLRPTAPLPSFPTAPAPSLPHFDHRRGGEYTPSGPFAAPASRAPAVSPPPAPAAAPPLHVFAPPYGRAGIPPNQPPAPTATVQPQAAPPQAATAPPPAANPTPAPQPPPPDDDDHRRGRGRGRGQLP